jgi:hypothetical protein
MRATQPRVSTDRRTRPNNPREPLSSIQVKELREWLKTSGTLSSEGFSGPAGLLNAGIETHDSVDGLVLFLGLMRNNALQVAEQAKNEQAAADQTQEITLKTVSYSIRHHPEGSALGLIGGFLLWSFIDWAKDSVKDAISFVFVTKSVGAFFEKVATPIANLMTIKSDRSPILKWLNAKLTTWVNNADGNAKTAEKNMEKGTGSLTTVDRQSFFPGLDPNKVAELLDTMVLEGTQAHTNEKAISHEDYENALNAYLRHISTPFNASFEAAPIENKETVNWTKEKLIEQILTNDFGFKRDQFRKFEDLNQEILELRIRGQSSGVKYKALLKNREEMLESWKIKQESPGLDRDLAANIKELSDAQILEADAKGTQIISTIQRLLVVFYEPTHNRSLPDALRGRAELIRDLTGFYTQLKKWQPEVTGVLKKWKIELNVQELIDNEGIGLEHPEKYVNSRRKKNIKEVIKSLAEKCVVSKLRTEINGEIEQ